MQSGFRNGKSEGQQTTGHDELSVNETSREILPASAGIMINVYGKEKEWPRQALIEGRGTGCPAPVSRSISGTD